MLSKVIRTQVKNRLCVNIHFNKCINAHQLISISVKLQWSYAYDSGTNSDQYFFSSLNLFLSFSNINSMNSHRSTFFPVDNACEDFSLRKLMNSIVVVSESFVLLFLFHRFFRCQTTHVLSKFHQNFEQKLSCDI